MSVGDFIDSPYFAVLMACIAVIGLVTAGVGIETSLQRSNACDETCAPYQGWVSSKGCFCRSDGPQDWVRPVEDTDGTGTEG